MLASALIVSASATVSSTSTAQISHGIAAVVNDDIVTTHDLRQRVLFMLATTGVERDEETLQRMQAQALKNLVDEKIQVQESDKYEQTISDAEIDRSVGSLLGRNGLNPQEVVQQLAAAGISINTLREQVRSEIAWQRIVNGLYGSRIRISDAQIDETLNRLTANASKPSYRVAEIYIEASPEIGGLEGALQGAQAMIAQAQQGAPFPLLAQQFSSAPSAAKGGDIGWVHEGELRPEIDEFLVQMEAGTISNPIQVPGGYYVIALVGKEVSSSDTLYKLKQVNISVDEGGNRDTAKGDLLALKSELTSCDTLKDDIAGTDGLNQADMGELRASEMSDVILDALAGVDAGQLTDPVDTPNGVAAILVCEREVTGTNVPTRNEVENRLMDQQLAQASKRHLRDLRRQATIVVR